RALSTTLCPYTTLFRSPRAARRFDSVCRGRMTRSRRANAKPRQKVAMMTVSVHWTFGVKSPVQWTLTVIIATFCLGFAFALRERSEEHTSELQSQSNLV